MMRTIPRFRWLGGLALLSLVLRVGMPAGMAEDADPISGAVCSTNGLRNVPVDRSGTTPLAPADPHHDCGACAAHCAGFAPPPRGQNPAPIASDSAALAVAFAVDVAAAPHWAPRHSQAPPAA